MFNDTLDEILIRLNEQEAKRLAPLICLLVIIVATGIPGNILVCLVYWKDLGKSISKFFIFSLAVSDFLSCVVVILEIANVAHQYTFQSAWMCKMTIFLETWVVMTSGCLLCIISIDRFRKVCHPFGWQINRTAARIMCSFGICLSLLCACPVLILYGVKDVHISSQNITGYQCGIMSKYHDKMSSKAYKVALWSAFVTSCGLLIILYSLIIRKLVIQPKRTQGNIARNITSGDNSEDMIHKEAEAISSAFQPGRRILKYVLFCKSSSQPQTSNQLQFLQRKQTAPQPASQTRTTRLAFIMCLISIVFVVSFLPHLILRLLEALDNAFVESMSNTGRAAHKTILRSYFLNCAINPFIYFICSTYFRKSLLSMFCCR